MVCKHGFISFQKPNDYPKIDEDAAKNCSKCGHCTAICPKDAVTYDGYNPLECVETANHQDIPHDRFDLFLRSRRTCRNFRKEPVPGETIARIVNSVKYSPTAKNSQGVKIAVVDGHKKVQELAGITFEFYKGLADMVANPFKRFFMSLLIGRSDVATIREVSSMILEGYEKWKAGTDLLFYEAPVIIVTYSEKTMPMPKDDCDYALFSMALTAENLGLGTCINGFLLKASEHSKEIRNFFGLKNDEQFFGAMALGFPSVKFRKTVSREPLCIKYIK